MRICAGDQMTTENPCRCRHFTRVLPIMQLGNALAFPCINPVIEIKYKDYLTTDIIYSGNSEN
jgi:hypothetical protein